MAGVSLRVVGGGGGDPAGICGSGKISHEGGGGERGGSGVGGGCGGVGGGEYSLAGVVWRGLCCCIYFCPLVVV